VVNQNGVLVIRPGRLAFVAVGEELGLGKLAARGMFGAVGGVRLRAAASRKGERAAIERTVACLRSMWPEQVDAETPRWVDYYGGVFLDPRDTVVVYKKLPFGERLTFVRGPLNVDLGFVKSSLPNPVMQRLLTLWPRG
jgi:hypothetical protein